jgi:hypothetical protein
MLDMSINTETHEKLRKRMKNREWLGQNLKEVQAKYEEQWVAIIDEQIIADGLTSDEVKGKIEGKHPPEDVIILRVPKGEVSRPI